MGGDDGSVDAQVSSELADPLLPRRCVMSRRPLYDSAGCRAETIRTRFVAYERCRPVRGDPAVVIADGSGRRALTSSGLGHSYKNVNEQMARFNDEVQPLQA